MENKRLDKIEYYLDVARTISKRATCLRRRFGAVIVVNDQIVAQGYCGAPRGVKDCLERETCMRQEANIPSGERYEMCRSVHAEQNAIINAARAGVSIFGGDIYIWGFCKETKKVFAGYPCLMCLKMVINAGLKRVYYSLPEVKKGYEIVYLEGVIERWNEGDVKQLGDQKE